MRRRRGLTRWRASSLLAVTALAVLGMSALASSVGASEESARVLASPLLLTSGSAGSLVADLQAVLRDLGHDPGPVDGVFGPLTDAAVRTLQTELGIRPDGIVGPETRAALRQVVPPDTTPVTTPVGQGALGPGDRGPTVLALQEALTRTGLYRGPLDGDFGPQTASGVIAFHKAVDRDRTTRWSEDDWDLLAGWAPSSPGYGSSPTRLEVDLERQLLFYVSDGSVAAVMPVSSGSGEPYTTSTGVLVTARTPIGDFRVFRHVDGWDRSYLGELYEPWYFVGGYAVHGSRSVPTRPASHGCVRVGIADAEWLDARLFIGIPVHIRG